MIEEYQQISKLAKKYGIDLSVPLDEPNDDIQLLLNEGLSMTEINIDYLSFCAFRMIDTTSADKLTAEYERKHELLSLLLLYTKAVNNNAVVETKTTIKAIMNKVDIKQSEVINIGILKMLNTMCGNLSTPYTEDEIVKFIDANNDRIKRYKQCVKSRKRDNARNVVAVYKNNRIFGKDTKVLTSKEFQFLYDAFYILGVFVKEDDGLDIMSAAKKDRIKDYFRV